MTIYAHLTLKSKLVQITMENANQNLLGYANEGLSKMHKFYMSLMQCYHQGYADFVRPVAVPPLDVHCAVKYELCWR
jgi:hypothetical protein